MLAEVKTRPSAGFPRRRAPFRLLAFLAYGPLFNRDSAGGGGNWFVLVWSVSPSAIAGATAKLDAARPLPPLIGPVPRIGQLGASSAHSSEPFFPFGDLSYAYDKTEHIVGRLCLSKLAREIQSYAYDSSALRIPYWTTSDAAHFNLSYAYDKMGTSFGQHLESDQEALDLSYAYDNIVPAFDRTQALALDTSDLSYACDKMGTFSRHREPDQGASDLSYAYDKSNSDLECFWSGRAVLPTSPGLTHRSVGCKSAPPDTGPPPRPHIDRRRQIGRTPQKPATRRVFLCLGKTR